MKVFLYATFVCCTLNISMPLTRATNININSGTAASGAVLAADGVGGASWIKQTIPTPEIPIVTGIVLPGAVVHYAMQTAPDGWLVCDGAAVSRLTYPALFAAIGTSYGAGDGVTTFKLPDLRGEFIRGWDGGRGIDGGRAFGTLQGDVIKSHSHAISDPGHTHPVTDPGHVHVIEDTTGPDKSTTSDGPGIDTGVESQTSGRYQAFTELSKTRITIAAAAAGITVAATGSSETRPRNIALLPCIKY